MPIATLHKWQRLGWVHSRKVTVASGRLALWAEEDKLERLRQLRAYKRKWPEPRYPQALPTPKPQDAGIGCKENGSAEPLCQRACQPDTVR